MDYHQEDLMVDGPVHISYGSGYSSMNTAWMDSFQSAMGRKMEVDPRSGGTSIGAFQNGATIDPKTKTRSYAQSAYLSPEVLKRPNLTIVTDTRVKKIIFDKKEAENDPIATGIICIDSNGEEVTYKAKREVILAAGAFQSPQLLELSGIGNKAVLEKNNINVMVENSNVGEHIQDHPIVCWSFEVNPDVPSGDVLRDPNVLSALVQQYKETSEGPLGQSSISVAYTPLVDGKGPISLAEKKKILAAGDSASAASAHPGVTKEAGLLKALMLDDDEPVFQYILFPSQITINKVPSSMAEYIVPSRPENYITVMVFLNHPFSRGTCHITSSSAMEKPEWDPKYNKNAADMELLARGTQFVERLVSTPPLSKFFKEGGNRVPDVHGADVDLEKAKEVVRQAQISVFHVSSSCAMLPREMGGVVDERLRVYGVKGLRVVDASVFPLEPSGNIISTVYAVAEKAAHLIKEDIEA